MEVFSIGLPFFDFKKLTSSKKLTWCCASVHKEDTHGRSVSLKYLKDWDNTISAHFQLSL